jgi:anti-sigma B factor antagonist
MSGRIVLGQESDSLRTWVTDLLGQGHNKILLNFAHVDYIDSSGVGYLVGAFTSVRNHKGELPHETKIRLEKNNTSQKHLF